MKAAAWILIIVTSTLGGSNPAQAGNIFDSLAYRNNIGDTVSGQDGFTGSYTAEAMSFTASETAAVSSIEIAAFYAGGTNVFALQLRSDNAGAPGAVIESFSTPLAWGGQSVTTVLSTDQPILRAGVTYWLALLPGASDSAGGWNQGTGSVQGTKFIESDPSFTSGYHSTGTAAPFLILGTPAAAVPEPASMSLLAAGALGILGYRSRRRNAPAIVA